MNLILPLCYNETFIEFLVTLRKLRERHGDGISYLHVFLNESFLFSEPGTDSLSQFVLDQLFNETYNKNTVPSKRSATVVTIEFVIQNIAQVSEISASFTLDLLFR